MNYRTTEEKRRLRCLSAKRSRLGLSSRLYLMSACESRLQTRFSAIDRPYAKASSSCSMFLRPNNTCSPSFTTTHGTLITL